MSYVHKSRAAKRSQKKQDDEELQKVLAKTPSLNRYFSGSTSASASTSSQIDEPSSADIRCSDYGENIDVATPEPVCEDFAVEAKFPLRCEHVRTEKDAEHAGKEYPTDVGLWQIPATHDMREFWAETGREPCQNKKSEYPASRLEDGNRQVRYFPSSLFSYVHKPTQTKFDRSWLMVMLL